jgi:hypothetical protein
VTYVDEGAVRLLDWAVEGDLLAGERAKDLDLLAVTVHDA